MNQTKPTVKRGVYYWKDRTQAVSVRDSLVPAGRVVEFSLGIVAVQLHRSGPYLGPGLDIASHSCNWCVLGS